jgi:hypothetical protein
LIVRFDVTAWSGQGHRIHRLASGKRLRNQGLTVYQAVPGILFSHGDAGVSMGVRGISMGVRGAGTGGVAARAGAWWRSWRARFGLAEVCGTAAAVAGFAVGYRAGGSLLAAAGLATLGEFAGFYGCVGVKTALTACRATAHLAGWRRFAAAAWHAVTQQLASCAAAEALDFALIRPGCLAGPIGRSGVQEPDRAARWAGDRPRSGEPLAGGL